MPRIDSLSLAMGRSTSSRRGRRRRTASSKSNGLAGNHHEDAIVIHAVPLAEELVDDLAVSVAVAGTAAGAEDGVCLVDEDDARRKLLRQAEDCAHHLLALANILLVDLRTADFQHCRSRLFRDSLSEQRLSSTRRPVQHQTSQTIICQHAILESIRSHK